jgi:hypothetical protein
VVGSNNERPNRSHSVGEDRGNRQSWTTVEQMDVVEVERETMRMYFHPHNPLRYRSRKVDLSANTLASAKLECRRNVE